MVLVNMWQDFVTLLNLRENMWLWYDGSFESDRGNDIQMNLLHNLAVVVICSRTWWFWLICIKSEYFW